MTGPDLAATGSPPRLSSVDCQVGGDMRSVSVRNRAMLAIAAAALAVGALLGSSGFATADQQSSASLSSAANGADARRRPASGVAPGSLWNCTPPSPSASVNAGPLDWWC